MFGLLLSAAGSLYGMSKSGDAARQTKSASFLNATLVRQEAAEEERRLKRDISQSEGLTKAMSAASGVTMSGSRKLAVDEITTENKLQLDWLKKAGRQKERVVLAGGNIQANQLKAQATQQGISALASIYQASSQKGLFE